MAQNAGIPKIFIDCAMTVHKDISEQKMFRGMNRDGIKAASIYIFRRLNGCQRTAYEIADIRYYIFCLHIHYVFTNSLTILRVMLCKQNYSNSHKLLI